MKHLRFFAMLVVFSLIAAACSDGQSTTTIASTTITTAMTTTVAQTVATTTTSTTTTTTIPAGPGTFRWESGVAEIGILTEPEVRFGYESVILAGELLEVYRADVTFSTGKVPAWFMKLSFGVQPETGE